MIAERNETIGECVVTLKELSEDERIRMECQAREDLRRDFVSAMEKGIRQGIQQAYINMRRQGMPRKEAQAFTQLSDALADEAESSLSIQ